MTAPLSTPPRICQPPRNPGKTAKIARKTLENGKNKQNHLGKTAKIARKALEKRQKQIIFAKSRFSMALFRHLNNYLKDFYASQKTALLLTGARQTGKTYAIRQLGKQFKSFVEINFIEKPEAIQLFKDASSVDDILLRISAISQQPLYKGETLIFLTRYSAARTL